MGLEDKPTRRAFLEGAAVLAAASALKIPGAASAPTLDTAAVARIQPELISSPEYVGEEEVHSILRKLLGDVRYRGSPETKTDANGLFRLEVTLPDSDGYREYSFRRGRPEKEELPGFRIDMTYYDSSGMPISGHSVAEKNGNTWKLTP